MNLGCLDADVDAGKKAGVMSASTAPGAPSRSPADLVEGKDVVGEGGRGKMELRWARCDLHMQSSGGVTLV